VTNLLLAPVGAGKTEAALARLLHLTKQNPFAKVWVLLSGERQIHAFRQRLLASDDTRHVYFNVSFFNFYKLYAHLLNAVGHPRRCLDEGARSRLLRSMMADMQRGNAPLDIYGAITHTPGFVRIVADFIYELKQNVVYPEMFNIAAESEKDAELALIYHTYQSVMQQYDLVDREGEGWLAMEALEGNLRLGTDVDLLLVDGFDQFNYLQARLLALLASRVGDTLVTLTSVPGREATIGRRFQATYERLQQVHDEIDLPLIVTQPSGSLEGRDPALGHVIQNIFRPQASRLSAEGGVTMIEAPDPLQEVGAVLRQVKNLLLDKCPPNDILIALRDWTLYSAHFASLAHEYGLASLLAMQYSETLAENPAITALTDLLHLSSEDFRRRSFLDVLRSPYFEVKDLDGEVIDHLDRVSRALMVTGGRANWLEAVRTATTTLVDQEDESKGTILTAEMAKHLELALPAFFDRVTPPPTASVTAYVRWLETLIGDDPETNPDEDEVMPPHVATVKMLWRLRQVAGPGIVERDLAAMQKLKDVLRALVSVQDLLQALDAEENIDWRTFLSDLQSSIVGTVVQRAPNREGRVLVTTVTDARGLPHQHVFILGLSEGLFPARVAEDPLYLDSERRRLTESGVTLPTQAERADDDGLFYELISLAHESLTLSRPYIQNGAPWPASHLWRGVMNLFDDTKRQLRRIPLANVVPADQVACVHEAALAIADGLGKPASQTQTTSLYNWLMAQIEDDGTQPSREYWKRLWLGRTIEKSRLSAAHPYDRYSGRLTHPAMIGRIAEMLHPGKVWSASQLNDYGMCAFRYYAGRLLKLETMEEPEDGMNVLQAGTINHNILERTYKTIGEAGIPIAPDYVEHAVTILHEAAREEFRDAPRRLGFQASALWEQEKEVILRRLEALVRHDFSVDSKLGKFGDGHRVPYRLEAQFGASGIFTLDVGDGIGTLRIGGKIDRIDRIGDHAVVVDYKTGSTKIGKEELARGRNFQMMLYLLAAREMIKTDPDGPTDVAGGIFWHIGSREVIGDLRFEDDAEAIDDGLRHLGRYVERGRGGDFAAQANKMEDGKCARYCEFHVLCRVGTLSRRKRQD
jgi:ATP-dependent helicase/nuclease subunit B